MSSVGAVVLHCQCEDYWPGHHHHCALAIEVVVVIVAPTLWAIDTF